MTGTYTFTTTSDDGVRLYVNGQLVVDNWTDHGVIAEQRHASRWPPGRSTTSAWTTTITGSSRRRRLSWAYPGQTMQVVPQWVLYPAPPVNQPPAVDAGADKTITLPSGVTLTGIARDDGLPGPALTTTWSKISGREDSAGGTVALRQSERAGHDRDVRRRRHLRAAPDGQRRRGDGQRRRHDHRQPRAAQHGAGGERGSRRTITLPSTATLNGTATDDGLPSPPAQLSKAWTKVSGPGTVTSRHRAR